jgi:catechol 2,3-dioxygenase-like lactoylglutathione lyase family enzyme
MALKPNRGIDHLVLCTRNLEAARRTYTRLGFTLTPHACHPWGTGNSLVQLQGNFLELLTVDDPSKLTPPGPGEFGFGVFNEHFMQRREGLSMVAFASDDARRDRDEFAASGLTTYATFDFARQASLPNGSEVTVAFSLTTVTDERMPEAGFFVCQHRAPQYFWKPEYQRHANGAIAVSEVVMVAAEPPALADLYRRLQGPDAVRVDGNRLDVTTARGAITVLDPDTAAMRFRALPLKDAPETPHFVGCRVTVRDLDAVRMRFDASDVRYRPVAGAVQIAPDITFGAYLELASE